MLVTMYNLSRSSKKTKTDSVDLDGIVEDTDVEEPHQESSSLSPTTTTTNTTTKDKSKNLIRLATTTSPDKTRTATSGGNKIVSSSPAHREARQYYRGDNEEELSEEEDDDDDDDDTQTMPGAVQVSGIDVQRTSSNIPLEVDDAEAPTPSSSPSLSQIPNPTSINSVIEAHLALDTDEQVLEEAHRLAEEMRQREEAAIPNAEIVASNKVEEEERDRSDFARMVCCVLFLIICTSTVVGLALGLTKEPSAPPSLGASTSEPISSSPVPGLGRTPAPSFGPTDVPTHVIFHQLGDDIDGDEPGDLSGYDVAISSDGNRVAISTLGKYVRVYEWATNQTWMQLGSDILSNGRTNFGYQVDLARNGSRVAIGDPTSEYGVPNATSLYGRVQVFDWDGDDWNQLGSSIEGHRRDIYWADDNGWFGWDVSMSEDGTRLVALFLSNAWFFGYFQGSYGGIRGFSWNGTDWEQVGPIFASPFYRQDPLRMAVTISPNGERVFVTATHDGRNGMVGAFEWYTTGVFDSGWRQVGPVIIGEPQNLTAFGTALAVSGNGHRMAVSDPWGPEGIGTGHIRIFDLDADLEEWVEQSHVEIVGNSNVSSDGFGYGLGMAADGQRIVVSASGSYQYKVAAGAVEVFDETEQGWRQFGTAIGGEFELDFFGVAVAISNDGHRLVASSVLNDGNGDKPDVGHTRVFELPV